MAKDKVKLGRGARGLPRYYMDVGWYRHPHFVGLPLDSLGLFEAIVGYSTEHGTDGVVPGDPEDLAAALGLRTSAVKKALRPLIDRGRIMRDGGSLVLPAWGEHNPTSVEIEAYSDERSASGSYGNHKRWHVDKNEWKPDECVHCAEALADDRNSDRYSDETAIAQGSLSESHSIASVGIASDVESVHGFNTCDQPPVDNSELRATRVVRLLPDRVPMAWARTEVHHAIVNHPLFDDAQVAEVVHRQWLASGEPQRAATNHAPGGQR